MSREKSIPSVSVNYACTGSSTKSNELDMRPMPGRTKEKLFEMCTKITSGGGGKKPKMGATT